MKKLFYLVALIFISSAVYSQMPNFTGTWTLNKDRSVLGEQFSMAPSEVEINQEKNLLVETRQLSFQGESFTTTDKYSLDGKECENTGWMETIKKSTASWTEENTILKIITKIPMQGGEEMTLETEYMLMGLSLVIRTKATSSYGEVTESFVFDKKD